MAWRNRTFSPKQQEEVLGMNQTAGRLPQYIVLSAGMVFAIIAGLLASGQYGNPISAVAPMLALGLMFMAVVNYRRGLYLLLASSAYLDFVKRLLLTGGTISFQDITKVLAIAPILALGLFLGCYIPVAILRRRKFFTLEPNFLIISAVLLAIFGVSTLIETKSIKETINATGQSGIYLVLIPLAYSMFTDRSIEEVHRLLRFALVAFLPVPLYGFWQLAYGYSDLEIAYMNSGMTITINLLITGQLRPFSTMSSPQAYGTMMFFWMVISLYNWKTATKRKAIWLFVFLIYLVADILSTTRGAMIFSLMSAVSMFWFASKLKTLSIYVFGILSLLLVILNARWLLDNLAWLDSFLPHGDSQFQNQLVGIQTFSDRLQGFINVLGNPRAWSLFGNSSSSDIELTSHDLLSQLLLRSGAAGVFIVLTALAFSLIKIHGRIMSIQDVPRRRLASMLLNIVVMFLFLCMTGSGFQVFPLNLFVFLFSGLVCAICFPEMAAPVLNNPHPPAGTKPTRLSEHRSVNLH